MPITKSYPKRGFASMNPERQREIASLGGLKANQLGRAHKWTTDEARAAGLKGGRASGAAKARRRVLPQ